MRPFEKQFVEGILRKVGKGGFQIAGTKRKPDGEFVVTLKHDHPESQEYSAAMGGLDYAAYGYYQSMGNDAKAPPFHVPGVFDDAGTLKRERERQGKPPSRIVLRFGKVTKKAAQELRREFKPR